PPGRSPDPDHRRRAAADSAAPVHGRQSCQGSLSRASVAPSKKPLVRQRLFYCRGPALNNVDTFSTRKGEDNGEKGTADAASVSRVAPAFGAAATEGDLLPGWSEASS